MGKGQFIPFERPDVADAEAELEHVRSELEAKGPLPHRWAAALRRELDCRAAAAAVGTLGYEIAPAYAAVAITGGSLPRYLRGCASMLAGYVEGRRLAEHWSVQLESPWTTDVLVSLHTRVLGGNWPAGAGEIASETRTIVHPRTGAVLYEGPPPEEISKLLSRVWLTLSDWRGSASIRSAWAHAALIAILPFRTGNEGVAELMANLCRRHGGYSRIEFGSLEHWWGSFSDSYLDAVTSLADGNVTDFVRAHLHEQIDQAGRLDLFERIHRQVWIAIENMLFEADLDPRLADPLWDVFQGRELTAGTYAAISRKSPATATADLTSATQVGLLRKEGERRGRRYFAGPELHARVGAALAVASPSAPDDEQILSALRARLMKARRLESAHLDGAPEGLEPPVR